MTHPMTTRHRLLSAVKRSRLAADINAHYKAWKVERDAAATVRRFADEVKRRQLIVPQDSALETALRARVAARTERLGWPKPIGELHLFLAYSLINWEAVLPAALSVFGRVSEYEWRARGYDEGAADWIARRETMNQEMLAAFHAANAVRPVDVVVGYLSGYTVAPDILREMASSGATITNFCFDDKIYWPGKMLGGRYASTAAIADAVDLNLSSDPDAAPRYFAQGGLCAFHAEAADPSWYRPLDIPFDYDVSFVGAAYGWRPRLVKGLKRLGIDVACFGKGWPNGPLDNSEMNALYARSRINLGCGGIGFSHKLLCLKGRDFEVPMSGAVYLTQDNPELARVFDIGNEILTYTNIDDCASTIRSLLEDPTRAAQIRRTARLRCITDHSYTARWRRVFELLGAVAA